MSHDAFSPHTTSDHKVTASVPPVTVEGKVKVDADTSPNPVPLAHRSPPANDVPSAIDTAPRSHDEPTSETDSDDDSDSDDDEPTSDAESDSDPGIFRPSPYFDASPSTSTAAGRTIASLDDVATLLKTVPRSLGADLVCRYVAKNVIVLVGAGCSVSAGIPDFRSPETGLYANLARFNLPAPEAIFDLAFFKAKPEPFFMLCKDLYPVDTLETTAGLPRDAIVEAHGSFAKSHCIRCHRETPHEEMVDRDLPQCDLLLVIGTSLQVHPFASLINYVPRSCPRILINKEKVGEARGRWDDDGFRFEDGTRDFFWGGEADVGLRQLAEKLGWKLKKEWGIVPGEADTDAQGPSAAPFTAPPAGQGANRDRTSAGDEDRIEEVLATLAEDLKKVGLEEGGKSEL
ncbi:hypothetical protein QFC21_003051 [Naganishia friedmannii]|uniref:Uncharacterized protein n=1 Tax=Naganishia friedmannii TaxID=89922 RepID=A0ACC2VRB4_9TREE|nr:hypothetical protein QFC21_003051 [Naganishia friedmannii]